MAGDMQVSVDRDFARFGNKSYAINKINSVEVRERSPHSQNAALGWGLLAVIFLLSALGGGGGFASFLALVFGALAYWAWQRSKVREYQLFLMTSSSEAQAIVSRDSNHILSLRETIEQAMTKHSAA